MLCSYDDLCYIICTVLRGRYCVIQHSCCNTNKTIIIIGNEHVHVLMTRGYDYNTLLASTVSLLGIEAMNCWRLLAWIQSLQTIFVNKYIYDAGCFAASLAGGYKWQYILIVEERRHTHSLLFTPSNFDLVPGHDMTSCQNTAWFGAGWKMSIEDCNQQSWSVRW